MANNFGFTDLGCYGGKPNVELNNEDKRNKYLHVVSACENIYEIQSFKF